MTKYTTCRYLLCSFFIFIITCYQVDAKNLDSSDYFQLEDEQALTLSGVWIFNYGVWCKGKNIDNGNAIKVDVPSSWTNYKRNGVKYPWFGNATYSCKVVTQSKGKLKKYGIKVYGINTNYSVYINDELVIYNKVETHSKDLKHKITGIVDYFVSDKDTLNVLIHISNFSRVKYSGIYSPIIIGSERIIKKIDFLDVFKSIAFIVFFGVSLFVCVILLLFTKKQYYLYLIVFCSILILETIIQYEKIGINYIDWISNSLEHKLFLASMLLLPLVYTLFNISSNNAIKNKCNDVLSVVIVAGYILILVLPTDVTLQYHIYTIIPQSVFLLSISQQIIFKDLLSKTNIFRYAGFLVMIVVIVNDLVSASNVFNYFNFLGIAGGFIFLVLEGVSSLFSSALLVRKDRSMKVSGSAGAKSDEVLLRTLSHDLMNTFNNMLLSVDLLKRETNDSKNLTRIINNINGAISIVRNGIQWQSVLNNYSEDIVDLRSVVDRQIELMKSEIEHKQLRVECLINNRYVFKCNPYELNVMIGNLMTNAIKFSHLNASIIIRNLVAGDKVFIEVYDSGIGIPSKLIEKILKADENVGRKGTLGEVGSGKGLILVSELARKNNAKLHISSVENRYTRVLLEFSS